MIFLRTNTTSSDENKILINLIIIFKQEVVLQESRYGGHQCAMPAEYEVKSNKKDLRVTLTNVGPDGSWTVEEDYKVMTCHKYRLTHMYLT